MRLALHLTGSEHDAEDIYQEAFLKAFRYIGNFRFECSFYTWIYRIVTNLCLDQLRRRKTRREDHAVVVDHSGDEIDLLASVSDNRSFSNPAKELDRKLLGEKIQAALVKLTPRERMVFELKHYQGLRLRTIGEMLNTTEETAKNTLFRATKKLRAQLAELRIGRKQRGCEIWMQSICGTFWGWKDVVMNCELAHERIVTAAYGELADDHVHELERHLGDCAELPQRAGAVAGAEGAGRCAAL